jgi:hypothetical protein
MLRPQLQVPRFALLALQAQQQLVLHFVLLTLQAQQQQQVLHFLLQVLQEQRQALQEQVQMPE